MKLIRVAPLLVPMVATALGLAPASAGASGSSPPSPDATASSTPDGSSTAAPGTGAATPPAPPTMEAPRAAGVQAHASAPVAPPNLRFRMGTRLSSDLLGVGGMVDFHAGVATQRFIYSGGVVVTGAGAFGASARASFLPFTFWERLRPYVAADLVALFPDGVLPGMGGALGLELQPRPGMAVTVELSALGLLNPVPGGRAGLISISTGVHFLP